MNETHHQPPHTVIGIADGMHAARVEARRIIDESKGDLVAEQDMLLSRLAEAGLIRAEERESLLRIFRVGHEASRDKGDVPRAFFEARRMHAQLAASGTASPVALLVASATVGAFDVEADEEGTPTVVVYKFSYGPHLTAIGAGIGALIGGAAGGILGGEIGGFIGGIIDSKKDDKKK